MISSKGAIKTNSAVFPWLKYSNPSILLQPHMNPGNCWPCTPPCMVEIDLCRSLAPTNIAIHHIPESISTSEYGCVIFVIKIDKTYNILHRIASAPMDMIVKVNEVNFEFQFDISGPPIQTFPINSSKPITSVNLQIVSSWNHPKNIACLYKVQIY